MKKDPEQEKWWRDFRIPGTKKILKTSSRRKTGNRNQKLSRAARRAEFDHWKGGNSNSFFKRVEIEILLQMFYRLLNIGAWNSRDFSAFFSFFFFCRRLISCELVKCQETRGLRALCQARVSCLLTSVPFKP